MALDVSSQAYLDILEVVSVRPPLREAKAKADLGFVGDPKYDS